MSQLHLNNHHAANHRSFLQAEEVPAAEPSPEDLTTPPSASTNPSPALEVNTPESAVRPVAPTGEGQSLTPARPSEPVSPTVGIPFSHPATGMLALEISLLDVDGGPSQLSPDIGLIMAVAQSGMANGAEVVRHHHEQKADGALSPWRNQVEHMLVAARQSLLGMEENVDYCLRELKTVSRSVVTQLKHGKWLWYHRLLLAVLGVLCVLLLAAEWSNACILLMGAGVDALAHSKFAALCASSGAVVLALGLKVAASTLVAPPKLRYALLLVPGLCLLMTWIVLMALAFPNYASDPSEGFSNLTSLNGPANSGFGLPKRYAWMVAASSSLGLALCAAGVFCFAESLYMQHQGAEEEENPQFTAISKELAKATRHRDVQKAWVGRLQGELERLPALKEEAVNHAVIHFHAARRPPEPRLLGKRPPTL